MKTLFVVLGLVVALSGCATVGRKIDPVAIEQIKIGTTTMEQVLQLIGSPDAVTQMGTGGTVYTYIYARATAKAESFIPIVGSFAGGANTQSQFLSITFDQDGVVSDFLNSVSAMETGYGASAASKGELDEVEGGKREK
ncbi:MAG: outer membrane protein assembly factor BamE [Candidatus Krumholzibacteriia bacterium]